MEVFDYYQGFKGEPEIRIIQKNKNEQIIVLLKIWDAYFDAIIKLIKPNDITGQWEGFTLHYHLAKEWVDGSWQCDDIPLFLKQLESINENVLKENTPESIEKVSYEVLKKLKSILKNTIDSNEKIIIEYH